MEDDPGRTEIFDDFYGVVLNHVHAGLLRWSPQNQAWLRRRQEGDWLGWEAAPVDGDEVDADEYAAALLTVDRFLKREQCPRCDAVPLAQTHYVALDVLGEPEVLCVQLPATDIVGGRGVKKHVGGPAGCTQVKRAWLHGPVTGLERPPIVGGLVYGRPLLADQVILREWCQVCATAAGRQAERPHDESLKDDHYARLRELGRALAEI